MLTVTTAGVRHAWDAAMFNLVIRKRARVPAGDSFIVRRVAGPGLASDFFYQIKTEQALVALEARMEMDELQAYKVLLQTFRYKFTLFLCLANAPCVVAGPGERRDQLPAGGLPQVRHGHHEAPLPHPHQGRARPLPPAHQGGGRAARQPRGQGGGPHQAAQPRPARHHPQEDQAVGAGAEAVRESRGGDGADILP